MTKPVFAYTVIKLSQKHIIDLDTPLYKYYPYEDIDQDDRYKLITARMVLSHTSGFPNWRGGGGFMNLPLILTPELNTATQVKGMNILAL